MNIRVAKVRNLNALALEVINDADIDEPSAGGRPHGDAGMQPAEPARKLFDEVLYVQNFDSHNSLSLTRKKLHY